ncbi:hypothetical protein M404DRAFT_608179 [Pisolithus tinctorius Marx 270]|uniref:Uncharacterized protein n=1 Tax=Pisolithus tinctorius Marx 270 TaxID=870435 RepID=A0A0C3J475_PISTI|nr:hypothetical protein M404DRAFT_608179 [Pisolithus tinctorius Marx 270]
MPPTSRVQVRPLSRDPAEHAPRSLTHCHATNIRSVVRPLSRDPAEHAMKSLTSCHTTHIKRAVRPLNRDPAEHAMKSPTCCHATNSHTIMPPTSRVSPLRKFSMLLITHPLLIHASEYNIGTSLTSYISRIWLLTLQFGNHFSSSNPSSFGSTSNLPTKPNSILVLNVLQKISPCGKTHLLTYFCTAY